MPSTLNISREDLNKLFGQDGDININGNDVIPTKRFLEAGIKRIHTLESVIKTLVPVKDVLIISVDGTEGSGKTTIVNNSLMRQKYIYDKLSTLKDKYNIPELIDDNIKKVKFPRVDSLYGSYFYMFLKQLDTVDLKDTGVIRCICSMLATLDRLEWVTMEVNAGDIWLCDRFYITNKIAHGYINDLSLKRMLYNLHKVEEGIFGSRTIHMFRNVLYDIKTDNFITYNQMIYRIEQGMSGRKSTTRLDKEYVQQLTELAKHIDEIESADDSKYCSLGKPTAFKILIATSLNIT